MKHILLLLCLVVSAKADTTFPIPLGKHVIFSFTCDGTPPFTCQWRKDAVPITGATFPTLEVMAWAATDVAVYDVVVSNTAGSAVSDKAITVTILPPTTVKLSPPQSLPPGTSAKP